MHRRHESAGFTLIELMITVGTIAIIAAIALPNVLRARIAANEASALASLRVIHTAQSTFASECGGNGYAQRLADLVTPPAGSTHAFISPDLGRDPTIKSGYVVTVEQKRLVGVERQVERGASARERDTAVSGHRSTARSISRNLAAAASGAASPRGARSR